MRAILVVIMGIISVMYLLNVGMGIIEFIPDNIPYVGNLDEAGAAMILLMCLRYFGLDMTRIFNKEKEKAKDPKPLNGDGPKPVT